MSSDEVNNRLLDSSDGKAEQDDSEQANELRKSVRIAPESTLSTVIPPEASIPAFNARRLTLETSDVLGKLPSALPSLTRHRQTISVEVSRNSSETNVRDESNVEEIEPKNESQTEASDKNETTMTTEDDENIPAHHTNDALTQQQIMAFKEAFDLFDNDGGGTIDEHELKETLQSVGIEIEESEIHDIMSRVDKDGDGAIDFDDFLNLMTNTEMFMEAFVSDHDPASEQPQQREKDVVLFDAVTEFVKKSALKDAHEIVGYYAKKYKKVVTPNTANKGAHVVGHYANGARLLGLSQRQFIQQMKKLLQGQTFENKQERDSPYAQPLQMSVIRSLTTSSTSKRKAPKKEKKKKLPVPPKPVLAGGLSMETQRLSESNPMSLLIRQLSTSQTATALPGANVDQSKRNEKIIPESIFKDPLQKKSSLAKPQEKIKCESKKKDEITRHKPGWVSQRNKMYDVVINIPPCYRNVQVDTLPKLRKKVDEIKGRFSNNIAKQKIERSLRHYKELDSRRIPSPVLYEQFKKVFCAYSSARTNNSTAVSCRQLGKASTLNDFQRGKSAPSRC
ncbi:uncharacterized protein LOC143468310 [Clavelina lepadiformis]|uniref:uncharacterized protein LOC143468310 n=1 Tax=Clavelina lepadiformis TaxID=159417 RepID=UPI004042E158